MNDRSKDPLKELNNLHWNRCSHILEPVGCRVRVLTQDCEIFIAYRRCPSQGYTGEGYFRVDDGMPIDGVVYWSYL